MQICRAILFLTAFFMIVIYWLTTFVILGDAPFLAGPQDEADRAMAFFLRRTVISIGLVVALFVVFWRLARPQVAGKPKEVGSLLD